MTHFNRTPLKTNRARQLRADATVFERKLWAHLRGAQMNGFAFRRQHPVGPYVLDFYCAAAKLAVELDGDQHGTDAGLAYDAARTRFLKQKHIRVIRFGNHELNENLVGVRDEICRALQLNPTDLPSTMNQS
ncbi:MAG TPA: endonuclease domain-containing protein [Micropepsaceae bacterium]|jgi:very-short-patch-repair endonuclease|nr:endonuclease domain-containing protein [Micropepsaceae bacterium]